VPWERQPPDPAEEIRHKQNVALVIGTTLVASGVTAIGAALATQTSVWFRPLVIGGALVAAVGLYPLLCVPLLGAPFPSPRQGFVLRPVWDLMPLSKAGRHRRAIARFQDADKRFRRRLEREGLSGGFNAIRAVQTLLEEAIAPHVGSKAVWIHAGVIGYGPSGNIALTSATAEDAPEVVEIIHRFEALAASARKWPEFAERQRREQELKKGN
jgi:hypothetical protein